MLTMRPVVVERSEKALLYGRIEEAVGTLYSTLAAHGLVCQLILSCNYEEETILNLKASTAPAGHLHPVEGMKGLPVVSYMSDGFLIYTGAVVVCSSKRRKDFTSPSSTAVIPDATDERSGESTESSCSCSPVDELNDSDGTWPDAFQLTSLLLSEEDHISETNWLTSTFIDFILSKFARVYPKVHFLPTDFVPLHLKPGGGWGGGVNATDILGRQIAYDDRNPIVFVANIGRIHWNLFRVVHDPEPELQLFEPMGRPDSRNGSAVSARCIPHCIVDWLDGCFPHASGWRKRTVSAITERHQYSGFDCGVACLLYADKCGQGQNRRDINAWTDQMDITCFRKQLQLHLTSYHQVSSRS